MHPGPSPRRVFATFFVGVSALILTGCHTADREQESGPLDRVERWREDVRTLAHELPKRHKNLFFKLSRSDFEHAVAALDADIPTLSDAQIVVRLLQLVAAIGDGHTRLWAESAFHVGLPIKVKRFSDGVFVVSTVAEYPEILGTRIVRVGTFTTQEALAAVGTLVPHDNDEQVFQEAPGWLTYPEVLHSLHVTDSPDATVVVVEDSDGRQREVRIRSVEKTTSIEWKSWPDSKHTPVPLYRRNTTLPYWFEYRPDQVLLYIAYNSCVNSDQEPFGKFVEEVFDSVEKSKPACVVLDLRNNSGGDSSIGAPLIGRLTKSKEINRPNHLFVLIGRRTYSSALWHALELRERTHAILVGEPTGGKPNGYGEIRFLELPHCRFKVNYSTKYWRKITSADPPSLMPDVHIETSSSDYAAGRDPVLDAVLNAAGR